jgi:hypothetical protein
MKPPTKPGRMTIKQVGIDPDYLKNPKRFTEDLTNKGRLYEIVGTHYSRPTSDYPGGRPAFSLEPGVKAGTHVKPGLHIGTSQASQDRMLVTDADTIESGRLKIRPHTAYSVTAQVPESEIGSQVGYSKYGTPQHPFPEDPAYYRNPNPSTGMKGITGEPGAAEMYKNAFEDPGSTSMMINDPKYITKINRLYEAASTPMMVASLANMASGFLGGPTFNSPANWVFNDMMAHGPLAPPPQPTSYTQYSSSHPGRGRRKTTTKMPVYYDAQGGMIT